MVEAFLVALATLAIVLYGQTRIDARAIRRSRSAEGRPLVLPPHRR